MNSRVVVGVGNIYASEALYAAGIRPTSKAGKVTKKRFNLLAQEIVKILRKSISFKRPGTGISPFLLFKFLNKKAKKFIPKDTILKLNDFK